MWQRKEEQEGIIHTFKKQQGEAAKEIAELRKELKEQKEKKYQPRGRTQGEKPSSSEIFPKKKMRTLRNRPKNFER